MSVPDMERPGVWTALFPAALKLMTHLESQTQDPPWTFGGGTVLMLRINHRLSKDIDLFVPDPQYLGYINPRLSDVAEQISSDYEEGAEVIRFYLPAGEIDIIVGSALTASLLMKLSMLDELSGLKLAQRLSPRRCGTAETLAKRVTYTICVP